MKQASRSLPILASFALISLTALNVQAENFDAAPFGKPLVESNSVGVQWPENRRVMRVQLDFAQDGTTLPSPESLTVEYWCSNWKGEHVHGVSDQAAGAAGWNAKDDWYNGEWKTAESHLEFIGRSAVFTLAPVGAKEFPKLQGSGPNYRPTLKLRVKIAGAHPNVEKLRTFTDSRWQNPVAVRLQFENRDRCEDTADVYNASYAVKQASQVAGGICSVIAEAGWVHNVDDSGADRSIVTIRAPRPFSFAVDEVERGDRIFIKDFGVLVTRADDPATIAECRRDVEQSNTKTIYARVADHAEQTLSGAWNDMPIKHPYYFILGLEGGRERFRVDATGDIHTYYPIYPQGRKGRDSDRLLWPNSTAYRFGLPEDRFAERHLAEGYLPIVSTNWLAGGVLYEQEAFATLLNGDLKTSMPMAGDDPVVALVKLRFVNTGAEPRHARLMLSTQQSVEDSETGKPFETLRADGDKVMGSYQGREVMRYLVDLRGKGQLQNSPQGIAYKLDLPAHQEHSIYVKLPFITLTEKAEIDHLRLMDPVQARAAVAQFWTDRIAAGSSIHTPEPWLNDFYRSGLTHLLINDERELGADRYMARVGSFYYGAFGNESIMMISDLDRRGYAKEAERTLELFLQYQGTRPLPGNFTNAHGVLNGAGGYESGDYNQHHGWILWGLAEHYWDTRDRTWMQHAAPHIVDACQWIIEQRKTTEKLDEKGNRIPEYGLLPAGSLEDVTDFWPWLSTNAFTWWGMANAAAALKDFGHPAADELVAEAEAYRQDILQDYREASVRAPVVRLRDGSYVPHFPTTPYTHGREYGWLRETLEGSIMLPITRVMDPASPEAMWIMNDYEDNRYISTRYGYSIPVFDQFWFSRGGFSMQPNLLHGPLPYYYRDDIKQFLRAYFNPFAAGFDHTLKMFCEHALPELGYFLGEEFKTSDEAQSSYWLRLMFVGELNGNLHLGRALPRYWLRDGETVSIHNAQSYFGKLSYDIRSKTDAGKIEMSLDPPTRNAPNAIVVRFRHPEEKPIRSVTLNGQAWTDFDAAKGDIRLPGKQDGHVEIVALY